MRSGASCNEASTSLANVKDERVRGRDRDDGPRAFARVGREEMLDDQLAGRLEGGQGVERLAVRVVACPLVDAIRTELRIACDEDGKGMTITDKTTFSSANATSVRFGEDAVEKTTRGGRKKFRLSGDVVDGGRTSLITCELFQRGPGWYTEQRRFIDEKTGKLVERNVLKRPGEPDVVVDRYFVKKE